MKLASLLVGLLCASALFVPAQDDGGAAVKSKIVALEKAWNQAYKLGDRHALDGILDDQIVLISDDGSVQSKAEFLASIKKTNSSSGSQDQQVAPESISVHLYGNTAIATGVFRAKGVQGGKPYVRRERFVDTWVNKGGTWVCVATNATPVLH
jgi:ketosteroid isomerase-like protein